MRKTSRLIAKGIKTQEIDEKGHNSAICDEDMSHGMTRKWRGGDMKDQKKRIYIAGKITGDINKEYTKNKFQTAAYLLRWLDYDAINPTDLDKAFPKDMEHGDWMTICLAAIRICDAVFALSDYRDSEGATAEIQYAKDIGIPVIGFYNDEDI